MNGLRSAEGFLDRFICVVIWNTNIGSLTDLPISPPSLYFDLEGTKLSREDSISIVQLLMYPENHTYLIGVLVLGETAFTVVGKERTDIQKHSAICRRPESLLQRP